MSTHPATWLAVFLAIAILTPGNALVAGASKRKSAGKEKHSSARPEPVRDWDRLLGRLHVPLWPKEMSPTVWREYMTAARELQWIGHADTVRILSRFSDTEPVRGSNQDHRGRHFVVLLLTRILFELPTDHEHYALLEGLPLTRNFTWDLRPEEKERTRDLAWPLSWRKGEPVLLAAPHGYSGPPYSVIFEMEYAEFKKHFRYRRLPNPVR